MKALRILPVIVASCLVAAATTAVLSRPAPLPADLAGVLAFVSDREGQDALYLKVLPSGQERMLAVTASPVRDPAVSPQGTTVAFSLGGHLALVDVGGGSTRILADSDEFEEREPAWRPDGRAIVITANRPGDLNSHLQVVELDGTLRPTARRILTDAAGLRDSSPVFTPDGSAVVFVRQDGIHRIALSGGHTARITSGFRLYRSPHFLPNGRIAVAWSQDKRHGIDIIDSDGRGRETLLEGSTYYRSLSPSLDGRWLAATFLYDSELHLGDIFRLSRSERVDLIDLRSGRRTPLAESWRFRNHSPSFGPRAPLV
jgi:Tol biopolymer transport system component